MITRTASARYEGFGKDGKGHVSTQSGVLSDQPYGFNTRFENEPGTNPEELIAAAHAACFSMALSLMLGQAGLTPDRIETHAEVTLEKIGEGFEITASHLNVVAKIRVASEERFLEVANQAKEGCPVSKLLKARITMDARLEK